MGDNRDYCHGEQHERSGETRYWTYYIFQFPDRSCERGPVQKGRNEYEEQQLGVAIYSWQTRNEGQCEAADYKERRVRDAEPARKHLDRRGDGQECQDQL